jgi:hypothetical protein
MTRSINLIAFPISLEDMIKITNIYFLVQKSHLVDINIEINVRYMSNIVDFDFLQLQILKG